MKLNKQAWIYFAVGAVTILLFQSISRPPATVIPQVMAAPMSTNLKGQSLERCEVFFRDDRDQFEEEINARLKEAKVVQSSVLWSETTKNIGFYALICY